MKNKKTGIPIRNGQKSQNSIIKIKIPPLWLKPQDTKWIHGQIASLLGRTILIYDTRRFPRAIHRSVGEDPDKSDLYGIKTTGNMAVLINLMHHNQ